MTANPLQTDFAPELMIEARQLTRTFRTGGGPFEALKSVDFAVRRGEFVANDGPRRASLRTVSGRTRRPSLPRSLGTTTRSASGGSPYGIPLHSRAITTVARTRPG